MNEDLEPSPRIGVTLIVWGVIALTSAYLAQFLAPHL